MGSNPRHPVEGEDWTFTQTTLYTPIHGDRKTKTVHVLGYHDPSHTVWGIEKGDAHPTVYQPHQWRLWSPPKARIPDFTRYIHVGESNMGWHPDGIRTSTQREGNKQAALHRYEMEYPFTVKLVVKNGKATATVLD